MLFVFNIFKSSLSSKISIRVLSLSYDEFFSSLSFSSSFASSHTSFSSSRTKQRLTWSRHLQLTHASSKWSTRRRHFKNECNSFRALWHALHDRSHNWSRDWMRTTLIYDERWLKKSSKLNFAWFICTFSSRKINNVNFDALCIRGLNCWFCTTKMKCEIEKTTKKFVLKMTILNFWFWKKNVLDEIIRTISIVFYFFVLSLHSIWYYTYKFIMIKDMMKIMYEKKEKKRKKKNVKIKKYED